MLIAGRVAEALEIQRENFLEGASRSAALRERYAAALDTAAQLSAADLSTLVEHEPWPGARATEELDERGLIVPFGFQWQTAQEARAWALDTLRGTPVVAVDGSQIAASKEFGVPLSLVQVAWFENYHDPDRPYVKDVYDEIVTTDPEASESEEYAVASSAVNRRRFALEMEIAAQRLTALASDPVPLVLVDGTFILSFIRPMPPEVRQSYLQALFGVLDASREARIPIAGYVDLSFATDLVSLLRIGFDLPAGTLFDASLLSGRMAPFDRTAAFQSARHDVMHLYKTEERDHSEDLLFVYLQIGQGTLPSRVDFPRWILDAGLLDHVLDLIRAEIVVGTGYPYAIETADAAAVLTTEDRAAFYRLVHGWAEVSGLNMEMPGKTKSKLRRR
jgi:hypothetical protein